MTEQDEQDGPEMETVHLLRRVSMEFGLRQAEFAHRNGMHPTDVRALVCLLDSRPRGDARDHAAGWGRGWGSTPPGPPRSSTGWRASAT